MLRLQNEFRETSCDFYYSNGVFLDYHEKGRDAAVKYPQTVPSQGQLCETENIWDSADPHYITENLPGVGLFSNRNISKIDFP